MPRQARLDVPGLIHHVMARGIEGRDIFLDSNDRQDFLQRLQNVLAGEGGPSLYAWTLMSNHFHLLIRPEETHLSTIMQRLMTGYAINFNKRHQRIGHLFQNRYKSIVVDEDAYLLELVRYIHLNPVRVGIICSSAMLNKYKYSGHSVIMGNREYSVQDVDGVLSLFSNRRPAAMQKYLEFIEDGFRQGVRKDLQGGGLIRSAGGIVALMTRGDGAHGTADERILGSGDFVDSVLRAKESTNLFPHVNADEILQEIAEMSGISVETILGPSRDRRVNKARLKFFLRAHEEAGVSLAELGRMTGRTHVAVVNALKRVHDREDKDA